MRSETMIGLKTNPELLDLLLALALARPDYGEALSAVATACGLGHAFAREMAGRSSAFILVEQPSRRLAK